MIGKSLKERLELLPLPEGVAIAILNEALATHARPLVEVRAQGASMIACLIVRADKRGLRLCRDLGFETTAGKTGVFGLVGEDAARLFPQLTEAQRAWLAAPCGSRETKVLLIAGGLALLSVQIENGRSSVRVAP